MWCPSHKFFYVLLSVTQSLFLLNKTLIKLNTQKKKKKKKKSTYKKEPTSVSEITT